MRKIFFFILVVMICGAVAYGQGSVSRPMTPQKTEHKETANPRNNRASSNSMRQKPRAKPAYGIYLGWVVEKDEVKARKLIEEAATQGCGIAEYYLKTYFPDKK